MTKGRAKRNDLAFIEGIADCGADLWRCGIYIYFFLCIRVAEIEQDL